MIETSELRHDNGFDGIPFQSEGQQFPNSLPLKLEEIAALLNTETGRIGRTEQIVAMILDCFDTLPPRISVSDSSGNEIWGIATDSVIKKSPISRRKSRRNSKEAPHPPVNPFEGVTMVKATEIEGGISPQKRMNEVSDILATIALRVVKKQSGRHQNSPTDSVER